MNTYRTDNVYLASYLKTCNNVNFVGIQGNDGTGNVDFHFEPQNSAQAEQSKFLAGQADSNPKVLFNEFKDNKRMIFNYKNTGQTVWVGTETTRASNDLSVNTATYHNTSDEGVH